MKSIAARGAALGAALALFVAACQGPKHPPVWTEIVIASPSENVLWAVASQELQRMGFPLGVGADPQRLSMSSAWKTELAPFRGDGFRQRAEVRFFARDGGQYAIEARVVKEINDDIVRPLDPSYAKWEPAPDDVETAQLLLQRIQARLGAKLEVGEKRSELDKR